MINNELGCSKKLSGFLYKNLSNSSSVNFYTNLILVFECFKIGEMTSLFDYFWLLPVA